MSKNQTITTAQKYRNSVMDQLKKELNINNEYATPKIEKVVVNSGLGRYLGNASKVNEALENVRSEIARIVGQRPVITYAKKSIASFKVREGQPLGLKVTLRDKRMYDFLDRLIHIALPRSRDFKGISLKSIDGHGALTIGIKEHIIFPEVLESNQNFGFEITVVPNTRNRDQAISLYKSLGFPLKT